MYRIFSGPTTLSLSLILGFSLLACTPQAPNTADPTPPASSATASPEPGVSPTAEPQSTPSPTPPTPTAIAPSLSPDEPIAVSTGTPGQNLSVIQALGIEASKRFLDGKGETASLKAVLKDASGQALNPADFPLEWFSSRPADFAVDATGKVTALVDDGYTEISLRVTGSDLEARQLISVTAPVGGTSSRNSNNAGPTQENVNGNIEFQF